MSDDAPPLCNMCQQIQTVCFCGAPRTRALYDRRLRWANIDHPASDVISKQIERMLAEPQCWMDFAKELERENEELRKALEHYIDMVTLAVPDDWDISGMGGWPDMEQLEKQDIGEVARVALGINAPVNEVL